MGEAVRTQKAGRLAFFLSGGGARAAYQVGFLQWLGEHYPSLQVPILTGISAGAINAAYLANHQGDLRTKASRLQELWAALGAEQVFRVDSLSIARNVFSWSSRLLTGGTRLMPTDSLVDATPLTNVLTSALEPERGVLTGVAKNIAAGRLDAIAVTASNYSSGQSITWVQGRNVRHWDRIHRRSLRCKLHLGHVLASASLPIFFPAVRVHNEWYGDGGIRMSAPLSPAIQLGADKIIVVSTQYERNGAIRSHRRIEAPPPAQVLGALFNAIFLDVLDNDVQRLERMNRLARKIPPEQREGLREVKLFILKPSRDLGELASQFEHRLPYAFRFMTRGLGTREMRSNDILSFITFEQKYLKEVMRLGYEDAERDAAKLDLFLQSDISS